MGNQTFTILQALRHKVITSFLLDGFRHGKRFTVAQIAIATLIPKNTVNSTVRMLTGVPVKTTSGMAAIFNAGVVGGANSYAAKLVRQ